MSDKQKEQTTMVMSARDRKKPAGDKELIATPVGYLDKSSVFEVPRGHIVRVQEKKVNVVDVSTSQIVKSLPFTGIPRPLPGTDRQAWCTYALWTNQTQTPVTSFRATWEVPSEPATDSDQTIFLFNGLQGRLPTDTIIQPVLDWSSPSSILGMAPYWKIRSYFVWYEPSALSDYMSVVSRPVRVRPGDVLTGVVSLLNRPDGGYEYLCEFEGFAETRLAVSHPAELPENVLALEAYGVAACTDYPATDRVKFTDIDVLTGDITPGVNWRLIDNVTDCGQHTIIVNNTGLDGQIDIWFRELSECPALRAEIASLAVEIEDLQNELRTAPPTMKSFFVRQIRMMNAIIDNLKRRRDDLGCRQRD